MITKTRGIVFRYAKLRETSIIVTIFTEVFGLQSYVVNGVRGGSKSGGNKMALYQPLTLLDLVVYHREHANLNRIREVRCLHPYQTCAHDIRKITIMMFLGEILNKTIREESHSEEVFAFLLESFVALDQLREGVESFHLLFLLRLMGFIGFGAQSAKELDPMSLLVPEVTNQLNQLMACDYDRVPALTGEQRREILDCLLRFYKEHVEPLSEIKSIQVLRDTFA